MDVVENHLPNTEDESQDRTLAPQRRAMAPVGRGIGRVTQHQLEITHAGLK